LNARFSLYPRNSLVSFADECFNYHKPLFALLTPFSRLLADIYCEFNAASGSRPAKLTLTLKPLLKDEKAGVSGAAFFLAIEEKSGV
jgi:hypothetical protein